MLLAGADLNSNFQIVYKKDAQSAENEKKDKSRKVNMAVLCQGLIGLDRGLDRA